MIAGLPVLVGLAVASVLAHGWSRQPRRPRRRRNPGKGALSYSSASRLSPSARSRGVSEVARSPRGFMAAYRRAGSLSALPDRWKRKREAFIARHMAQVRKRREPLWKNGKPTRRHLALAMWAYSPTPSKLRAWAGQSGRYRRNESYENYDAEYRHLVREVAKSHNALNHVRGVVEQYPLGHMPPSVYDSVSQLVIRAREAEEALEEYERKYKR